MDRRHALTAVATLALVASALVGAARSASAVQRQAERFAGTPATAGLDAVAARFVPVPRAFSATVAAARPVRGDAFFLAYDAEGDAPMGQLRPWVLSLAIGRAMLPAIRTASRDGATLVVTLGRTGPPSTERWTDPSGTFTVTRVGHVID